MMDRGHFRFDVFEVDINRGELWKSGSKIKLQDKPFQLLVLLLERAGKTASRDELGHELWPENADVNFDASLKTAVSKLRQVLGDSASRPAFIKTVHLRGYRFVAPIVNLGEGDSRLENRQMPPVTALTKSRGAAADAIDVSRSSWSARLLAVLLAVAIIVAAVYVFRRNSLGVSRPSTQPVTLVMLRFSSASGDPKYGHFNGVFSAENTASRGRHHPRKVLASFRATEIRHDSFSRSSVMV